MSLFRSLNMEVVGFFLGFFFGLIGCGVFWGFRIMHDIARR